MMDAEKDKTEQPSNDIMSELNAHHQTLIYTIPAIVYFKDIQGRNMVVNKAFEEFVGLKSAEIIGKRDDQIFPHDLAAQCLLSDQEVMKNRKSLYCEEEATSQDGKRAYFETVKSPLYDASGNVVGVRSEERR